MRQAILNRLKAVFNYGSKILTIVLISILLLDLIFIASNSISNLKKELTPLKNHPEFWSEEQTRKIISVYKDFKERGEDEYIPYSIWGYKEHHSDFFNIEKHQGLSIRKTHYSAKEPEHIVWMFGGSTLFGDYAESDSVTIPSLLSKHLSKQGLKAKVYNFGIAGYYSTQEVYLLAQLLKTSSFPKPDLVVFYDGFNEYQILQDAYIYEYSADVHMAYPYTKDLFEKPFSAWLGRTLLFRNLWGAWGSFKSSFGSVKPPRFDKKRLENLIEKQAAAYKTNVVLANALSEHYNFKLLHFIQPTLFQKKLRSRYEEWFYKSTPAARMARFVNESYKLMEKSFKDKKEVPEPIFIDDCFDGTKKNVYIDAVHLSTFGNEKVAQTMLPHLAESLKK